MFQKTYWQRTDPESALYLTGQAAVQRLDTDIALCTRAVDQLTQVEKMRDTLPPDTAGVAAPGVLSYYDTPSRLGEEKISHSDYHDFDGCMLSQGWKRREYVRPQTVVRADDNYADIQSVRMTGLTVQQEKAKEAAEAAARYDSLVKVGTTVTFGVEGYRDHYSESSVNVDSATTYTGVNAGYTSRDADHYFWTLDGRIAHGTNRYSSGSGDLSGVPQYEGEVRIVTGKDYAMQGPQQGWFSPYIGVGARIFRDLGKGYVTNLNYYAYDRRIEQLYLPLGATWRNLFFDHLSAESNLEVDPLIFGRVNSRLTNGGGRNVVNTQSPLSGVGIRGDVMFGLPTLTTNVELGPYFRYWYVQDSEVNIDSCNGTLCLVDVEPTNSRLQYGVRARVSF